MSTDLPLSTLPVSECFTHTIQGEGPAAGRASSFIRFVGCNLSCEWCDSAYTWDASRYDLRAETSYRSAAELAAAVAHGPRVVVLTGGEPLLQQGRPAWRELLVRLAEARKEIHIETNGTVLPTPETLGYADLIMVSPKLPNAGSHRGHQDPMLNPGYRSIVDSHPVHLKVVCESPADVLAAAELGDRYGFARERIWAMPEGTTAAVLAERWASIASNAAMIGINASHRLHVLAWGEERGH